MIVTLVKVIMSFFGTTYLPTAMVVYAYVLCFTILINHCITQFKWNVHKCLYSLYYETRASGVKAYA